MLLKECYELMHGDFEQVKHRLMNERLIERFMVMFPKYNSIKMLKDALEDEDYEQALNTVNNLKDIAANLALVELQEAAKKLASHLKSGTMPIDVAILQKVEESYQLVVDNISLYQKKKDGLSNVNTRRKILIVEDDEINQEILASILEEKYDVITADNGLDGLEMLRKYHRELSLILLDVYMPICNGFEFLSAMQESPMISDVPVIVTTGSEDPKDEVRCLQMGAYDFVTKPYNAEIVLARVEHTIALKESMSVLSEVEYDSLTGMYTMQAFQHKVQQLLSLNMDRHFDFLVVNIEDFKLVNDMFGEDIGDEVLAEVAKACRAVIPAFVEARDGSKFFFLCECIEDIKSTFIPEINYKVSSNVLITNLTLKYGVYHDIDTSVSVSLICDRVKLTVEKIKHNYNENVCFYDASFRDRLIENQRMESAFPSALINGEFVAWYQPKVDLTTGKMIAAETLVRWIPEPGKMISPGKFIPLFETNGQIADLDEYIFEQVCRMQGERLVAGLRTVPVSINLSRISLYKHDIVSRYCAIAEQYKVPLKLLPLELTESATSDSKVIHGLVDKLIEAGFELHMDDFGTGYSSLSALASLPFSVIKMDKSLIDQIGNPKGEIVIQSLINAFYAIGMKLVAEGVETKEQIDFLREAGCYCIQGYYYSAPKSEDIFLDILNNDKCLAPN